MGAEWQTEQDGRGQHGIIKISNLFAVPCRPAGFAIFRLPLAVSHVNAALLGVGSTPFASMVRRFYTDLY